MRKLKIFLLALAMIIGGDNFVWAQVTDVSDKLVASGTNWPTFTSEKTGNSTNAPWQGQNVTLAGVKGACTLSDFKFAEVYYDKTTGTKYTVSQTVTGLDNGIYKFRIAAFARKENIWGDDNGKTDANNVRLSANNSSTYITSDVMAYYELVTEVTDGTLTLSISGVDDSNKSNWMGYTDATLLKLFSGSSYPADVKELVTNWDFTGCSNNNFPGWTISNPKNGNAWKNGDTRVEYWIGSAANGSFDYYQTLTGLPTGRYAISASMWNSTNAESGASFNGGGTCGVYGTSSGVTVFAGVTVDDEACNTYTTDEIIVTNGELRLGVKNNTTMTARWFGVDWIKLSYLGPVVASGTYYLYDATNEVFASRGANHATRMDVDKYGIPVTWDNWSQRISYKDWPGRYLFFDNTTPAGSWLFTDAADNKERFNYFAFVTANNEGGYYLKDNNQTCFVKIDGNVTTPTTTQAEATVWTLKTKAQRDEIVAAYPTANKQAIITASGVETTPAQLEAWLAANRAAKDKTSSVGTAKFAGNVGSWTWTGTRTDISTGAVNYGTDYAEAYLYAGNWSQTISGLSNGIYKVTVNAFERASSYETCNNLGSEGYEPVTAYFEANSQKVLLKSWYSEKTGTNNPNTTGEAVTAFNSDKYKNEVYAYVSDGTLTLKLAKPSYSTGSWVLFNNVTLTYYDTTVSDEDATAILAEADVQMAKPMLATLCSAISDAKDTFDDSRTVPNYNALREAIDASATSVDSYASMKTNYLDPLKAVLDANNFYSSSAKSTVYDAYKTQYDEGTIANATAASLNWKSGTRYEAPVNNMMMDIWKIGNTTALTDNSGLYINSWSTENKGTGDAADFANPFFEYWVSSGSLTETTLTGTLTGLTANTAYDVTANVRVQGSSKVAGSITMEVVGGVPVDVTDGNAIIDGENATGRYIKSYTATGVTDGDGNLVLKFNVAANSNISWLAFRDVNYATSASVASNDFTALNTAINSAESKTLGFENGEYAPYNNVAAIEALTKAKEFNQNRYYISSVISAATTALTDATWTANSSDMECVYNGNFALADDGGWERLAWTRSSNWGAAIPEKYGFDFEETTLEAAIATMKTAGASNGYAYYNQPGSMQYGNTGKYTMPLKANTLYTLTFKYASESDNSNNSVTASVLNSSDEGMAAIVYENNATAYKTAGAFVQKTIVFVTGTAGNYALTLTNDGNTVYTDVSITKASNQFLEFADGSVPAYAPGTYPSVKISRTLTANRWATAVYPFAVSGVSEIAILDSYDKSAGALGFTSANASTANKPFLMRSTSDVTEINLSDVNVAATVASPVATKSEASLKGTYTTTNITNAEKNYVLSNNVIYSVGDAGATINPYRAYIQIAQDAPARLTFFVDGEASAVEGITADDMQQSAIYNLHGQRVEKAGKGLYIQNGKKFVKK